MELLGIIAYLFWVLSHFGRLDLLHMRAYVWPVFEVQNSNSGSIFRLRIYFMLTRRFYKKPVLQRRPSGFSWFFSSIVNSIHHIYPNFVPFSKLSIHSS